MPTFVTVLRAINLGAHNRIAMSDLRGMLEKIGLEEPKTLLISGNAVFRARAGATAKLEQLLEQASTTHLGVTTDYFVRSAREWQALIDANPFAAEAKRQPARVVLMCLRDAPGAAAEKTLQAAIKGREVVRVNGRQAYFVYPDGMGTSKLTITLIERVLGTRGTARNWNTVLKLAALTQGVTAPTARNSSMPFKSKAQRRKFAELLVNGEISPETYEEWNRETGGKDLPERVQHQAKRKTAKRKTAKKKIAKRKTAKRKPARNKR